MFGWFKRLFRNPIENNGVKPWTQVQPLTACVGGYEGIPRIRVLTDHWQAAAILATQSGKAKRQKKKHSHLLAELKALEVKHEDA